MKLDAVLDQIDYGVKLVGIDHVGLGSDFDGVDGALPDGLKTVADYPNLIAGLQARGYRDADLANCSAATCCECGARSKRKPRPKPERTESTASTPSRSSFLTGARARDPP